ncbi:hypothetical protein ACFOY2_17815 [Nonomuraea purpurea]|uniref:Uncharacterized protein n=1 Tax=Nonomuraea purpurea TaxID=1849276 RepID=A0ABV8G7N6_9ACTN
MRSTKKAVALTAALAAATVPLLALSSPAMAAQPTKTTQIAQNLPLDWLSLDALSGTALLQRAKDLLGKGYVPSSLNVTNAANPQYLTTWVKDATSKVNLLQGLSVTDLPTRIQEQAKLGFQPKLISGTGTGPQAIFAVVFEKTTQLAKSQLSMTKETFAKVNTELTAAGYSVASLDVYGTAERPIYAAVWVASGAAASVKVTLGQTVEQRGTELLAKAKEGLRPIAMAVEPGKLYTTVWSKGSSTGLKEYLNLSQVTYTVKATQMKALGYTPQILSAENGIIASIWSKR